MRRWFCSKCGMKNNWDRDTWFTIKDGNMICGKCFNSQSNEKVKE